MAKSSKTKKETIKKEEPQKISVNTKEELVKFVPCEWVAQFDNDEPHVLAVSDINSEKHEVSFKIPNTNQSHITFTDPKSGKKFKIYARPRITIN